MDNYEIDLGDLTKMFVREVLSELPPHTSVYVLGGSITGYYSGTVSLSIAEHNTDALILISPEEHGVILKEKWHSKPQQRYIPRRYWMRKHAGRRMYTIETIPATQLCDAIGDVAFAKLRTLFGDNTQVLNGVVLPPNVSVKAALMYQPIHHQLLSTVILGLKS